MEQTLNHFAVFGEAHLRYILSEYLTFYHQRRPHRGLGNRPLGWTDSAAIDTNRVVSEVVCQERLGGLLRH